MGKKADRDFQDFRDYRIGLLVGSVGYLRIMGLGCWWVVSDILGWEVENTSEPSKHPHPAIPNIPKILLWLLIIGIVTPIAPANILILPSQTSRTSCSGCLF
jgi:hypothetical protein